MKSQELQCIQQISQWIKFQIAYIIEVALNESHFEAKRKIKDFE